MKESYSTSDAHRLTRFDKVYPSRKSAIRCLDSVSRPYGELVVIRYLEGNDTTCLIALYTGTGYELIYDTSSPKVETVNTYSIDRVGKESDLTSLRRATFGLSLRDRDLVIIHTEGAEDVTYLYYSGDWVALTRSTVLGVESTSTLAMEVNRVDDQYVISGTVPLDEESLVVEEGKIKVGIVNCGFLKDL